MDMTSLQGRALVAIMMLVDRQPEITLGG